MQKVIDVARVHFEKELLDATVPTWCDCTKVKTYWCVCLLEHNVTIYSYESKIPFGSAFEDKNIAFAFFNKWNNFYTKLTIEMVKRIDSMNDIKKLMRKEREKCANLSFMTRHTMYEATRYRVYIYTKTGISSICMDVEREDISPTTIYANRSFYSREDAQSFCDRWHKILEEVTCL